MSIPSKYGFPQASNPIVVLTAQYYNNKWSTNRIKSIVRGIVLHSFVLLKATNQALINTLRVGTIVDMKNVFWHINADF